MYTLVRSEGEEKKINLNELLEEMQLQEFQLSRMAEE